MISGGPRPGHIVPGHCSDAAIASGVNVAAMAGLAEAVRLRGFQDRLAPHHTLRSSVASPRLKDGRGEELISFPSPASRLEKWAAGRLYLPMRNMDTSERKFSRGFFERMAAREGFPRSQMVWVRTLGL